jgi:hypothetical protein
MATKRRMGSSLDDPINATPGVPVTPAVPNKSFIKPPTSSSDTLVNTDAGYPIQVKKTSAYAQQARDTGSVINSMRPSSGKTYTSKNDPLSKANIGAKRDSIRKVEAKTSRIFKAPTKKKR